MEQLQITLVFFISVSICVLGNSVAVFPPEGRAMSNYQSFHPFHQFQPMYRNVMPPGAFNINEPVLYHGPRERQSLVQPILHKSDVQPPIVPEHPLEDLNFTDDETSSQADDELRAAKGNYDYPGHGTSSYSSPPSYGYKQPVLGSNYNPPASASNYSPPVSSPNYTPPTAPTAQNYPPEPSQPSTSLTNFPTFKSDLASLFKPVTGKVASKVSGLIGLFISLLSGVGDDNIELKGLKDILINGIIRPLLVAKGGIKSLISQFTIPVLSILLINLEMLITIWWLWEDCPDSKPAYNIGKPPPFPSAPSSYKPFR